jgi:hypothetical protein
MAFQVGPRSSPQPTPPSRFKVSGTIGHVEDIDHAGVLVILDIGRDKVAVVAWGRAREALQEVGVGGFVTVEGSARSRAFIDRKGITRWSTSLRAESVGHLEGAAR